MIFEVLSWGGSVGDGRTEARYCTLEGVAKFGAEGDAYVAANEYLSAFLGTCMGLPIPPCALIRDDDDRLGTVSLRFGPAGERPPPVNVDHFVAEHPQLAADVIAFDMWIHNSDRSRYNLAYSLAGKIPPAVFDHDQALFHVFPDRGKVHLDTHVNDPIEHHIFADRIQDGVLLDAAIQHVRSVSQDAISSACDRLVRVRAISASEADAVIRFLLSRSASMKELLTQLVHPLQPSLP